MGIFPLYMAVPWGLVNIVKYSLQVIFLNNIQKMPYGSRFEVIVARPRYQPGTPGRGLYRQSM